MRARRPEEAEARGLATLGLARRAGRVVIGTRAVRESAAAGALRAVVLAADAGEGARRRLGGVLHSADVHVLRVGSRRRLGAALGRDDLVVAGVTDEGFAGLLAERLPGVLSGSRQREESGREERSEGAGRKEPAERYTRQSEAARQG